MIFRIGCNCITFACLIVIATTTNGCNSDPHLTPHSSTQTEHSQQLPTTDQPLNLAWPGQDEELLRGHVERLRSVLDVCFPDREIHDLELVGLMKSMEEAESTGKTAKADAHARDLLGVDIQEFLLMLELIPANLPQSPASCNSVKVKAKEIWKNARSTRKP